ncbi:phage tail spike protein [Streptococcus oralis subsp. tigurinus]|uniref:phage tail spike protein n=1 Tax=Streptococcus oralis TaxID=1303 RepID=UPI0039C10595
MLLTIHDANLQKVAFVDNDKQNTLNYYDDTWSRDLPTGSSTFEFTVFKKAIKSDTALSKAYQYLNERAWVSFRYHGRTYLFNVMTVEENEQTIKCYCENLNLDLINEHANPYKAERAMSFIEYCQEMGLLGFSNLSVGINEISDRRRTLEWEGQDTNLARLLSLAHKFDAEIEFETQLNADSSIKSFRVNVYRENDEKHQGVGRVRNDIQLTYGKNLTSITRKVDKTGVFNAIRPTGKRRVKNEKGEEVEEVVTLRELEPWSVMRDGILEFYQRNESLYAPISMQMYPSVFSPNTFDDQWIRKDFSYETDNPKELRRLAYNELKKHCYPAVTYEVDGFIDVEIGDTIKIYDNGFNPFLMIQARVSEQKISFTNPASNKTTFSNFKALENKLSDGIQAAFERLFEASKPYIIKLSTDKGVIFKNGAGESVVTPTLYKGGKPVTAGVTWRWSLDGNLTTGMNYLVRGSNVQKTSTLLVSAYIDNDKVANDELSFVSVSDGETGQKGEDGKSTVIHFAFSDNSDGSGLSFEDRNQRYQGYYSDYEKDNSLDKARYKWTDRWAKIKGGTRNYFKDSLSRVFATDNQETFDYRTYIVDEFWKNAERFKKDFVRISFDIAFLSPLDSDKTADVHFSASPWYSYKSLKFKGGTTARQHFEFIIDLSSASEDYKTDNVFIRFGTNYGFPAGTRVSIENAMLSIGSHFPDYVQSVEDVRDGINSKADQSLTQAQLNALTEKTQIHEAELKAMATMEALGELEKTYKAFVQANEDSQKKSEADLIEAGRRIDLLTTQFGGLAELKTFIDTYMKSTNEGLTIGKNDASSTIKVSSDRISMFSAGKEVMYISQGVINIDNGIFTASVQIGRFRTEQYHLNKDVNVIRYVG